jgi:hypothetical protein
MIERKIEGGRRGRRRRGREMKGGGGGGGGGEGIIKGGGKGRREIGRGFTFGRTTSPSRMRRPSSPPMQTLRYDG